MKRIKKAAGILLSIIIAVSILPDLIVVNAKNKELSLNWIIEPQQEYYDIEPLRNDLITEESAGDYNAYSFIIPGNSNGLSREIIDYNGKIVLSTQVFLWLDHNGLNVYETEEQKQTAMAFVYNNKMKLTGTSFNLGSGGHSEFYIDISSGKLCEWTYSTPAPISLEDKKPEAGIYPAIKLLPKGTYASMQDSFETVDYMVMVNDKGQVVKNQKFEQGGLLRDGLALAKQNGKWGYADKNGKLVIPCSYDNAYSFRDGVAPVKKGDKWGYIYKDGSICVDFTLEEARPSYNSRGWAKKNGKWGLLNLADKKVSQINIPKTESVRETPSYINGYPLKEKETAYYDLDGDGRKEEIRYLQKVDSDNDYYVKGIEIYINNKLVFKNNDGGLGYSVSIYDINKKDSRLDIWIGSTIENGYDVYHSLGQYYKGKYHIIKTFDKGIGSSITAGKKQDGSFIYEVSYSSIGIGHYSVNTKYQLKDDSLIKISDGMKTNPKYFMLKKETDIYQKLDKSSKKLFRLSSGDIVSVIKVVKKSDKEYLYINTLKGKKGWVTLEDYTGLFCNVYYAG